jgi:1,2-diacylglycerol 3-alpha-glucosyltransferase
LSKPSIFIVCTGVGHISRGYESFTIECFNALKNAADFELFLLKGGGNSVRKEIKIACVKRNTRLAAFLSKISRKEKYWIEQITFLIGMLPAIIRYKPKVIYYSDFILGTFLFHLRKFLKFKYKLLFSNGAPNGPPFKTEDHIQQLLVKYMTEAIAAGTSSTKQTLLPYGFNISSESRILSRTEESEIRTQLHLPVDKKIIISVGAINIHHKRMDYIVREFSLLDTNKYFLLLLGQIDEHSTLVMDLAAKILNPGSYLIKQVDVHDVQKYLSVSDYFMLASLQEGFGRVLIEAQQCGLLPIVHNYDVTREVLKSYAVYDDLTKSGILASLVNQVDVTHLDKGAICHYAYSNYSWDILKEQYEQMIIRVLT